MEPIADRTSEQYVEGLGTVTVLSSDVFDRWPGLESFDVCQDPPATEDDSDEPLPITSLQGRAAIQSRMTSAMSRSLPLRS